jgi:hypothetical protein
MNGPSVVSGGPNLGVRLQAPLALDLARLRYELGLSSVVELSQAQVAQKNANQLHRAVVANQTGEMK